MEQAVTRVLYLEGYNKGARFVETALKGHGLQTVFYEFCRISDSDAKPYETTAEAEGYFDALLEALPADIPFEIQVPDFD